MYRIALAALFSLMVVARMAPSANACDNTPCNPCGETNNRCICHNIGGPDDLGANCDGTGNCTYQLEGGSEITVDAKHFLGIIIGFNAANPRALAAHLNHGDGRIETRFNPPLHLASEIGPHRASNVECLAERALDPQPPEPGN